LLRGTDDLRTRSLDAGAALRVQLFAFPAGASLPEHSAATSATLQFVEGRATVRVRDDATTAASGTWLHVPPEVPHSVDAHEPTVMLLTRPDC
jgi:quercetin dioxygenase-like cupin family protein